MFQKWVMTTLKGVQNSLIIHEVLVAMGLFSCSGAR
jgi:hypothetical protein